MGQPRSSDALENWLARYRLFKGVGVGQRESDPYLGINTVAVYVRDQDRSLRFYCEQLGFRLILDVPPDSEGRWVAVAPPSGLSAFGLVKPSTAEEESRIGLHTGITLVTEDLTAKFQEWSARGVSFPEPPISIQWAAIPPSIPPSKISMGTGSI